MLFTLLLLCISYSTFNDAIYAQHCERYGTNQDIGFLNVNLNFTTMTFTTNPPRFTDYLYK